MKKILLLTAALILTVSSIVAAPKSQKELAKEREELTKMSRSELRDRATRVARREARSLEKDGWKNSPGALPIEKQLDRSYLMQFEYDEFGAPKFMFGEAISVGGTFDGAKMQALELAKQNLAGHIQTEVSSLIENTVANEQMSSEEATTISKSIMVSKNKIIQSIGRTVAVVEIYRELDNRNKEVMVRIAYSSAMARQAAQNIIRNEMQSRANKLHNELDNLL